MTETPAGPPPRPPISSRPFETAPPPSTPRRAYVAATCWLLAALLAVPTAWYAAEHSDAVAAALFEQMKSEVADSPEDLRNAGEVADAAPTWLTIGVLVLAVLQLACAGWFVAKRAAAARALLVVLGVLSLVGLYLWYTVLFTLPDEPQRWWSTFLALQAAAIVAGVVAMFGATVREWLTTR